jgi:hypothetical protein
MNTRFKVFASYNILQYLCDFIHVLIFVTVSKCQKIPKLTNIVIQVIHAITAVWNAAIEDISAISKKIKLTARIAAKCNPVACIKKTYPHAHCEATACNSSRLGCS